jgi:hypothetical protein
MPTHLQLCLAIYKRYIDDGIGIWTGPTALWTKFQSWVNSFGLLHWIFTELKKEIDYLNLTIRLDANCTIQMTLFEKALNLYLYLPPHLAHPPGVLTGLIYSMIRHVYRLTTDPADCKSTSVNFTPASAITATPSRLLYRYFKLALRIVATPQKQYKINHNPKRYPVPLCAIPPS